MVYSGLNFALQNRKSVADVDKKWNVGAAEQLNI